MALGMSAWYAICKFNAYPRMTLPSSSVSCQTKLLAIIWSGASTVLVNSMHVQKQRYLGCQPLNCQTALYL